MRIPLLLISGTASVLLLATVARGQDAAAKAAEENQNAQIQQYVQLLQPALWQELNFVRQVCDVPQDQRPKIKAAADAAVKQAAKDMVAPQLAARRQQRTSATAQQAVREGLTTALKDLLPEQQLARYTAEQEKRTAAYRKATVLAVVSQLDGVLFLNQEQRDAIVKALDTNWQPDWEQWMQINQYGGQYFPTVPDMHIVPHLNPQQQTIWQGLQKIMINHWEGDHNQRRAEDEAWWGGKPENAAKPKVKVVKKKAP